MMTRSAIPHRTRMGFTLIELLLAIFILGIGIISIAAVFPAGIIQQRRTQDDVIGPAVAEAAMATIRSRVNASDFGTFEEFGLGLGQANLGSIGGSFPNSFISSDDWFTVPGDWPWIRPSMAVLRGPATATDAVNYAGDIDIFSARKSRSSIFAPAYTGSDPNLLWGDAGSVYVTSELSAGPGGTFPLLSPLQSDGDQGAFLFGVPFNRQKYDLFGNGEDPLVTISQEERFWPSGSGFRRGQDRPQYAWECMFRRNQGRVQVGIFVYRINAANAVGGYAAVNDGEGYPSRPVLPVRLDLHAIDQSNTDPQLTGLGPLNPYGNDEDQSVTSSDKFLRAEVPGTEPDFSGANPANPLSLNPYFLGWQSPGQMFLDPYGRIHRVIQGRRNRQQGPVRLARPVSQQPRTSTNWNWYAQGVNPSSTDADGKESEVRSIWFIPPTDARGIKLTPVYITVRDL